MFGVRGAARMEEYQQKLPRGVVPLYNVALGRRDMFGMLLDRETQTNRMQDDRS